MSGVRHPVHGLALPDRGWVPGPQYLLRRARLLHYLRRLPPSSRVLEIGCGAGAMLDDVWRLGHRCESLEISPAALALAREVHAAHPQVRIVDQPDPSWDEAFDALLAIEVLEHNEDDRATLATWVRWLRPGGCLLVSVPAHPESWSAYDEWGGHYRRYTRPGLLALAREAGLTCEALESYGVPVHNFIEPIRARMLARRLARERQAAGGNAHASKAESTARSGIQRDEEIRLYPLLASWPGTKILQLSAAVQRLFLDTDLGTGYLLVARKTEARP